MSQSFPYNKGIILFSFLILDERVLRTLCVTFVKWFTLYVLGRRHQCHRERRQDVTGGVDPPWIWQGKTNQLLHAVSICNETLVRFFPLVSSESILIVPRKPQTLVYLVIDAYQDQQGSILTRAVFQFFFGIVSKFRYFLVSSYNRKIPKIREHTENNWETLFVKIDPKRKLDSSFYAWYLLLTIIATQRSTWYWFLVQASVVLYIIRRMPP